MIRVFVGCAPDGMDAESCAVLEWSIRKNTKEPVEIEFMSLSKDPDSPWYSDGKKGWQTQEWATPFSGFRWAIPERCEFEGKGVYTDSDVIFMADIASLEGQRFQPSKVALAKGGGSWRYCVSVWDCKEAGKYVKGKDLRGNPLSHREMITYYANHPHLTQQFVGDWNCLDGAGHYNLKDGHLKALHYTDMSTQPQLRYSLPRLKQEGRNHWFNGQVKQHPRHDVIDLFDELFMEACAAGYSVDQYRGENFGTVQKRSLVGYKGAAA